ncbi:hypothetical protein EVAR_44402_1 [Eumeta japonica]|uniref:Uncharacterized protein n=1 Tax=Eumeta variegata TaxID=151549 RepID=A0A4C1XU84_EUMVA|nr:hypothetical protein EVAR_44402_1 [Eumeta japonica]
MRLKGKVVVELPNADPSILIDLALIRANEGAAVLASSYQKHYLNVETVTNLRENKSMIDFIVVDDGLRSKVMDTGAYHGANSGTDHFLVVCRIKALCQRWRHDAKIITTELERIKVDLEKAYDKMKRNDLWRILSIHGVSSGLTQALQSLYRGSSACIRINGAYTDWFDIRRVVRQGYLASP